WLIVETRTLTTEAEYCAHTWIDAAHCGRAGRQSAGGDWSTRKSGQQAIHVGQCGYRFRSDACLFGREANENGLVRRALGSRHLGRGWAMDFSRYIAADSARQNERWSFPCKVQSNPCSLTA